ncbi:MAG: TlpA disulfide reductase family protein [Bryobacteraceae bacterium]
MESWSGQWPGPEVFNMRLLATAALFALTITTFVAPASAMPPVPRKSPEFTITDPSGKQILLSSFKGKLVVLPLMFTTCPHCQHEAQILTKLSKELGPGVQMLGAAFNDANGPMVTQFVKEFGVGFPVGYASRDSVISYLGLSVMDRWVVPQLAIIDQKGNIVVQSQPTGSPELQDEAYMRTLLQKLLKGGAPATTSAAPKKTAAKTN